MNANTHEHLTYEHLKYARILQIGVIVSFTLLAVGFMIYVLELIPAHVPVSELPRYWSLPVDQYLARTGTPAGWAWLKSIGSADSLNLLGICLLCSVSGLCWLALLPFYIARRDLPYVLITIANIGVLVLAASGLLGAGH